MSLEGDCHDLEVTPNFEFLFTFVMSFEGSYNELKTKFPYKHSCH
jgi:hypothetical protein